MIQPGSLSSKEHKKGDVKLQLHIARSSTIRYGTLSQRHGHYNRKLLFLPRPCSLRKHMGWEHEETET